MSDNEGEVYVWHEVPEMTRLRELAARLAGATEGPSSTALERLCTQDCPICARKAELGWWGDSNISHCRTCHRTWNRQTKQAHCATCHEHFSTPGNFDFHLAPVGASPCCREPGTVTNRAGELRLRLRDDGVWVSAQERPDLENDRNENYGKWGR